MSTRVSFVVTIDIKDDNDVEDFQTCLIGWLKEGAEAVKEFDAAYQHEIINVIRTSNNGQ